MERHHKTGEKEIDFPDGTRKHIFPSGREMSEFPDGVTVVEYPEVTSASSLQPPTLPPPTLCLPSSSLSKSGRWLLSPHPPPAPVRSFVPDVHYVHVLNKVMSIVMV